MTRDDIIRMAREVGLLFDNTLRAPTRRIAQKQKDLERFAALVASAERNVCAHWMMARGFATGHGDTIEDLLTELEWQVREQEREACAQIVEQAGIDGYGTLAAAARIRARGEK